MDKAQALVLDYDDEEDILYVSFKTGQEAVCIEQESGVLIRVHPETDEIVGYTIIDFLGKFSSPARQPIRVELPQALRGHLTSSR